MLTLEDLCTLLHSLRFYCEQTQQHDKELELIAKIKMMAQNPAIQVTPVKIDPSH